MPKAAKIEVLEAVGMRQDMRVVVGGRSASEVCFTMRR